MKYNLPMKDTDIFTAESIRNCQEYIISMQRELDTAVVSNNSKSIRSILDLLINRSKAVKTYSVWKITTRNKGKKTAGVDGIALPKNWRHQHQFRIKLLSEIDTLKSPDAIRRVYIPKSNGKKRPLGIPTIHDRIIQEIYRIALEPIVEYHFHDHSYGFRPKRSCHDAISHLFKKLSRKISYRYVVEGDIAGAFDNINHDHVISTLQSWLIPKSITDYVGKILKSGILDNGVVFDVEKGTPQGGVISPLLANVALTNLDEFCNQYGSSFSNPIVRYADDFIIVCKSEPEANRIKQEVAYHLHDTTGLSLSMEKTRISHINKGFDFLGFNIRKYKSRNNRDDEILLIKPQKEKITEALRDWKEVIDKSKGQKLESLLLQLRPKMTGWAMYYRFVVSKATYTKIDNEMWWKMRNWIRRNHNIKLALKRLDTDFKKSKTWFIVDNGIALNKLSEIPIVRFVKVKRGYRVYDSNPEVIKYWEKREYINAYNQITSVKWQRLFTKQKGKCYYCSSLIEKDDIANGRVHTHHVKPISQGGERYNYRNLKLVHQPCHVDIHRIKVEISQPEK